MRPARTIASPSLGDGVEDKTDASDLRSRAGRSSVWTVGGIGAANLLRLFSNVVLARLLAQDGGDARDDFGLMTMVAVFVMGLGMFSDVGVGPCIVSSRRGDDARFLNTAFSVQVARGFLLFGVALLLAPLFADWYAQGHPGYEYLRVVLPVAAFQAVIQGFNSTKIFSAERHLAMAKKIQGDLAGQIVAVVTMIVWAYFSPNVWALVAGSLAQALMIMIWSHVVLPGERNRFGFDRLAAAELFTFGRWIFVSTVVTFFALQIDKIVLGGLVPEEVMGVYGQAAAIVNLPQFVGGVLTGTVIFPLLATYARATPEVLQQRFLSQRKTLLLAAVLLALGVVIFSPVFFGLLYKSEFHDAGWIAPLMMIASWFFLLSVTSDRALLARGVPRALAVANLISFIGKVVGGSLGFRYAGLPGFIIGLSLGTLTGHMVVQYSLAKLDLAIHIQDLKYTAVAGVAGGAAYLLGRSLHIETMQTGPLLIQAAIGSVVCTPLAIVLYRRIRLVGVTG